MQFASKKNFRRSSPAVLLVVQVCAAIPLVAAESAAGRRPNVVLIMTDDQGYGDLSCHGNRELSTPALDKLHSESVRLTNFHVDPVCSPTRSALMTGRYSSRTGVWNTFFGRSLLRRDEVTLPQTLAQSGYRTGIFGKWHLGDNYPYRAMDRGFHESLVHGGGGIGQSADAWGNNYFDDVLSHNGVAERQTGYCTDVFFRAATKFIEENRAGPFFAYIPTNAPHGPYNVAPEYARQFRDAGIPSPRAEFYGMIVNIDENVGRLLRRLDELGLRDDTIVVWMTDNGSAAGVDEAGGFNAGMRGKKATEYEGGHRVPCFLRWPARFSGGRDVEALTAHIDLLPTLLELCGVAPPAGVKLDGSSLVPLLVQDTTRVADAGFAERTLFVHSQRVKHPQKWKQSAVMTNRWRLINGQELYDLPSDPGQQRNVAGEHPEVVAELRRRFEQWWDDISTRFDEYCRIELGAAQANPTTLNCHDWHGDQFLSVFQERLKEDTPANGYWAVDVVRPGTYRVTLRSRPAGVVSTLPAGAARLRVGTVERSTAIVAGADTVKFELPLAAGPADLQTWLVATDGTSRGANFVEVERIGE